MEKGYYSYLLSALPVVLRENLKRDPNIQNMEIVLVGLAAQSLSYENMLGRLQSVLQEINNEIHLHRQEVASRQMLFLNAFMLLLTAINIWLAARSFVVTHNELPMLSLS
ncbi:hypothetical protein HY213_02480 [Candidatus Peregrinibacteria bacterium]|nr:hypothetical protein [Candidatus Peregrinibacteria bacterium]